MCNSVALQKGPGWQDQKKKYKSIRLVAHSSIQKQVNLFCSYAQKDTINTAAK